MAGSKKRGGMEVGVTEAFTSLAHAPCHLDRTDSSIEGPPLAIGRSDDAKERVTGIAALQDSPGKSELAKKHMQVCYAASINFKDSSAEVSSRPSRPSSCKFP